LATLSSVTVWPDHDHAGVVLEITDQTGTGCRTLLDWGPAMDLATRLAPACGRLRGVLS
jgi:hypothetical protein